MTNNSMTDWSDREIAEDKKLFEVQQERRILGRRGNLDSLAKDVAATWTYNYDIDPNDANFAARVDVEPSEVQRKQLIREYMRFNFKERIKSFFGKSKVDSWTPKFNEFPSGDPIKGYKPALEGIVADRFRIRGLIGRGTWGEVYEVIDMHDNNEHYALKALNPNEAGLEQMEHRKQNEEDVVRKERFFAPSSHIIPREIIKTDEKVFVVMPLYREFLNKTISSPTKRYWFDNGIAPEKVYQMLRDISEGIGDLHRKRDNSNNASRRNGRVMNDLKPDNFAVDDEGRVLIGDLGASSADGIGRSISPRDNMGFTFTRAYECFDDDSHPTKRSDVFGLGSFSYRLFTGEYLFERELENDPDFYSKKSDDELRKIIKKKMKKVPKEFRKMLSRSVDPFSFNRQDDAEMFNSELEKCVIDANVWNIVREKSEKWAKILIPSAFVAYVLYAGATYEPKELSIPRTKISGTIDLAGLQTQMDKNALFHYEGIEKEVMKDLPKPTSKLAWDYAFEDKVARYATKNRNVAFLLTTYDSVIKGRELNHSGEWSKKERDELPNNFYYNKNQLSIWQACTPSEDRGLGSRRAGAEIWHNIVAKSIEYSMTQSVRPDGLVDLEDTLALSLVGNETLNNARRASGSFEFKDYISAKKPNGEYIISERDQKFLKQWIIEVDYKLDTRKYEPNLQ